MDGTGISWMAMEEDPRIYETTLVMVLNLHILFSDRGDLLRPNYRLNAPATDNRN